MTRESAAPGETGAMPSDIAGAIAAIGPLIDPASTAEIYAPLHEWGQSAATRVLRDLSYGDHERNVLDLFAASRPFDGVATGRPVLVFVHGGGFTRGVKSQTDSPFYDNVMRWAAGEGLVGININYRLAPEFTWPSGIEDLRGVVGWIANNVTRFGGDPARIFLWGHSAGAAHVADYIAAKTTQGSLPGVIGAILTSGFYDLGNEVSRWAAYYGDDVSQYAERSSLPALARSQVALLVNDAELDPEHFHQQARLLVQARAEMGQPVEYVHLLGHSHISETYAVGTDDTTLSAPVLKFIHEQVRG